MINFFGMTPINNNLCKFSHSLMVTFVAVSIGLSASVSGRGLNPMLSRRRHRLVNNDAALDRRLHERYRQNEQAMSYYDRAEQMDRLALLLAYMMRNSDLTESTRGKRQQCTRTMDSLISSYFSFYDTLDSFLGNYSLRLSSAHVNSALKDITAILELLPKNSKFIYTGDVAKVKEGINKTLQMTEYVMKYGGPFLHHTSQKWFTDQHPLLSLQMGLVYSQLGCVIKEGGSHVVQDTDSGIGGGTGGNKNLPGEPSSSTMEKIKLIAAILLTQG